MSNIVKFSSLAIDNLISKGVAYDGDTLRESLDALTHTLINNNSLYESNDSFLAIRLSETFISVYVAVTPPNKRVEEHQETKNLYGHRVLYNNDDIEALTHKLSTKYGINKKKVREDIEAQIFKSLESRDFPILITDDYIAIYSFYAHNDAISITLYEKPHIVD